MTHQNFSFRFSELISLSVSITALVLLGWAAAYASCSCPTQGIVACYPFNGNAQDESGNGNHGTVNGATLTADRFGNSNSAYKFDRINNDIIIPDKPSQQISTNQISISAWITLGKDIPNTQWRVVNKQDSVDRGIAWGLELFGNGYGGGQGNNLTFHNTDGSASVNCVASEVSLIPSITYHVAATAENNVAKIYMDGKLIKTCQNMLGIPPTINSDIVIGSTITGAAYFNGIIDDVRICNRALSDAEIQQLYNPCYTQAQLDAAKQTGIQSCKDNPASCSLFSQTQIDAAKQDGINLVKANPADYQLVTQIQLDQAVKAEQLKWDANGGGKIGLEDIIRMLQVIAGLRP